MKKMRRIFTEKSVVVIATLLTTAASLFAAMPCVGPHYEPEIPEELHK